MANTLTLFLTLLLPSRGLALPSFSPDLSKRYASDELLDYFIQDVCRDSSTGVAVAGDPASCPPNTYRNNINLGERTPFLLTDFDRNNNFATYQSSTSIPVHATDETLKILVVKSLQGNFDAGYQFSWSQTRDGYDLIDGTFSNYASFIRTSDPGCQDQIWSSNGKTAKTSDRAGGWILFPWTPPSQLPQSASTTVRTYHVQLTQNLPGCSNGNSRGVTYWNGPAGYTFETGKTLTAIRSFHYASTDLSSQNNALELYYFTKEYGFTRWEAWVPRSRCLAERGSNSPWCYPENRGSYPLEGRCSRLITSSTGVPGLDRWGEQDWVRVDCRDTTNYVPLNTPQLMLDQVMAQINGFVDINYELTVQGR